MESPDAALWEEAIQEELKSLVENETFILEVLPEGEEAVGGACFILQKKDKAVQRLLKPDF